MNEDLPHSYSEARKRGLPHYFTGRPCKHGHVSKRFAYNAVCCQCSAENASMWTKKFPKKRAAIAHRYNEANREANYQRALAWREANPEQWKALRDHYYRSHAEQKRADTRNRRQRDGDRIRERERRSYAANPEPKKMLVRRWQDENPERKVVTAGRRKLIVLAAMPHWLTTEQRREIREFYKDARRMTIEAGVQYSVDHIEPLVGADSCGLHVPWNLQVMTLSKNCSKGNRR